MGYSWSFFFALRIHVERIRRSGSIRPDRVIVEGRPCPVRASEEPLALPYCDNMSISGTCPLRVNNALNSLIDVFKLHGFEVHEIMEANMVSKSLGVIVDGEIGSVRVSPERLNRVIAACKYLETRPVVSGKKLSKFVGHVTFVMLLNRWFLSLLGACYKFVERYKHTSCRLWKSVVREIKWIRTLLPLCETRMNLEISDQLYASDARC